jgi:hypothetical protein
MSMHAVDEHLSDEDLVRILDGEADAAVRAVVAACGACSARADLLRRRSIRLASLLGEADWPVPDAGPAIAAAAAAQARAARRRGLGARRWPGQAIAAGMVLLLVIGLAVTPAGAWVVRTAGQVWSALFSGAEPAAEEAPPPADLPVADDAGRVVQFTPAGGELTLRFAASPGMLVLHAGNDRRFSMAVDGVETPDLLLLEDGVRIGNLAGDRAAYTVTVPVQTDRIRLVVSGRPVRTVRRADIGTGLQVGLE